MVGGSLYRVQEPESGANEMLKTIDKDWSNLVCRNLRAVTASRSLANASHDGTIAQHVTVTQCEYAQYAWVIVQNSTYNREVPTALAY